MKYVLCAAVALCAGALPLLAAPDTAYQALRTVGSQRGAEVLKHVIEVEGRGGVPEPATWRIVLDDPAATPEDLDALTARDELRWRSEREAVLLY